MFLALTQDIPPGHVMPLAQFENNMCLVNGAGFHLIGNVCPHQHSRIACGLAQHLTCPYHGLRFQLSGQGIDHSYRLETMPCYQHQTMLFDKVFDFAFPIDTQHMALMEHRQDIVRAPLDTVMDVFLDIDHIPIAHNGVYDEIGITRVQEIECKFFQDSSLQLVPLQSLSHMHPDDRVYNISACWLAVYPGTMIEWQPGALFVTVAHGHDESCKVEVYKYRDLRYSMDFWETNQRVWETAWRQDRDLSEGIVSLARSNIDQLKRHHRSWLDNAHAG